MKAGRVRELAGGSALASRIVVLAEVGSTMEAARERGEAPLLLVAEEQTAGRGREGRTWRSQRGENLTFTAALAFSRVELPPFTLACGVALHAAVGEFLGMDGLSLKWPNDLWWQGRKLAGILCECVPGAEGDVVLVGVGLNVNATSFPDEIASIATSMRIACGRELEREEVLARCCARIEEAAERYAREGIGAFLVEYRQRCALWGRACRAGDVSGAMETVDGSGGLVVRRADGSAVVVSSGHVELLD